jgi:hypothetical protein
MEFNLDGKYRSFLSEVCLRNPMECTMAPSRKRSEEVAFLVWGDDRKLAEATVNWKKPLNELRVDVTGIKVLKLEAQPRGISWLHMEAAWLEPELSTRELSMAPKEKPAK